MTEPANTETERFDFADARVGDRFECNRRQWQITDKGSRVIVAVLLDEKAMADSTWLDGPPYALAETVFDEDDFAAMSPHRPENA